MIKPGTIGRAIDIEDEVIALFADLAGAFGFPRSYGQIYGLIYASTRPLSFTDIQERLALSKGSVSQGLRTLREAGAIRRVEGADWRREHFAPETELRQLLARYIADSILPRLESGAKRVAVVKALLRKQRAMGYARLPAKAAPSAVLSAVGPAKAEGLARADLSAVGLAKAEDFRLLSARIEKLSQWHQRAAALLPMVTRLVG